MGFLYEVAKSVVYAVMKLVGLTPKTIEIEPGTIMKIWIPKQSIIKIDGKQVYIPPKKPVVLMVQCFAMNGIFVWLAQIVFLTWNYSVYVPDLLFFGGSTTNRTERSVSFQAEFLAKGMEILKVEKVNLVGLSYGGIVGFEMAKLYPNLVHSLVVTAAVDELTMPVSQLSLKQVSMLSWQDLLVPQTIEGFKRMMAIGAHKLPWIPGFIYDGIFETEFNNRKERCELLEALVIPEKEANTHTNYLQKIHMLWGEEDKIFTLEFAKTMKMRLGVNTTLEYVKNAGHLLPLEKPITYNRLLKRFLASTNEITATNM
ncbi:uncharacterized protein [Rutidosis leptorrhynchoides]|uniref:uncharacterized protein n=1 Tax=Rutidosis leptorrhynchoides TaxID=125765 RepID=UPI003A9A5A7D